jgi:hypothetical protein
LINCARVVSSALTLNSTVVGHFSHLALGLVNFNVSSSDIKPACQNEIMKIFVKIIQKILAAIIEFFSLPVGLFFFSLPLSFARFFL